MNPIRWMSGWRCNSEGVTLRFLRRKLANFGKCFKARDKGTCFMARFVDLHGLLIFRLHSTLTSDSFLSFSTFLALSPQHGRMIRLHVIRKITLGPGEPWSALGHSRVSQGTQSSRARRHKSRVFPHD